MTEAPGRLAGGPVAWDADPLDVLAAAVAGLGGETRPGQRALASAVADAIGRGHHLLAEAPTGSGKSLAYLAPAVASGLKVVVATSTIALQTQLVSKDLPALQEHSHVPFSYELLKGRSNYLCLAKLRAAGRPDALFEQPVGAGFGEQLHRLRELARTSATGDRSEAAEDVGAASWAAVSCTSVECPGRADCADGAECFAERARDRAQDASVLVVNHALYCAHLAAEGRVLPEHDIVVLDEAHAFADNATNAFAGELAADALARVGAMLGRSGADPARVQALGDSALALADAVESRDGPVDLGADEQLASALRSAAERLAAASSGLTKTDEYAKRASQLALGRLEVLRRLAAPADDDVVWVERFGRARRLRVAPIAPGDAVARLLFERRPVIAVSATLGGAPPFAPVAIGLGLDPAGVAGAWAAPARDGPAGDGRLVPAPGRGYAAVQTPSSFDWREQGVLYVGSDLPDPGRARASWLSESSDRLCRLVHAAGGRTLVLCTSHANVAHFAEVLRTRTDHVVLAQGDADTGRLARAFVDDEASVLVGTRSFWAGIDAAGVACVLVVIDKIPFPVPDDPLHAARRRRAAERGLDPFAAVDLPAAALVLAQGAGRLLRRRDDRGVVAVFDSRLANRPYRTQLLAAMPPFRRSVDLAATCEFLEAAAASGVARAAEPAAAPNAGAAPDLVDPSHDEPVLAPGDVRRDLDTRVSVDVRNAVACPFCGAGVGKRCRDGDGTLAFLHAARVAGAPRS